MFTAGEGASGPFVARLGLLVLVATVTAPCADNAKEVVVNRPGVTSVTQVTRDGVIKTNLLSDETNLYVTESPAARHVVARVSLPGVSRSVISNAFPNVQALDLSPDRSTLLVSPIQGGGDSEFWTLPVNAGSPKRVGDLTGRDATWSADGQHLVFSKGSKLLIATADGSSVHELFTANGSVFAPRFSPDGKRVRFTVGDAALSGTSIWEVGSDGSNPHSVLGNWQGGSTACCGSWTADGRYYIFQATQSSPTTISTLWALPDSGPTATPVQLTNGPMSFGNASPARDNSKIWAIGVQPVAEAVRYDSATKNFVPLLGSVSATDLDYSADGKWVSYVSMPDAALWRCRADGSDRLQLTSAPERAALPKWSPDGSSIAYVRLQPGKPSKLSVIPAGGGTPKDILVENRSQIDANWSSDGKRIMFGSFVHDTDVIYIRVVDLKTGQVVNVPGSEGLFSPRWSPDRRYIVALSSDMNKVMLFDYQTEKWTTWLTEPAGTVSYPVWSADSKYLYFDDLVTDEESIRRIKVGESRPERVFKLEGIERYPGPFGLWSGRTANGSWMFVRDRSTQEVYQLSVALP
jgi:Tol biopolymer transport system component